MRFNKLDLNLLVALDVMLVERSISRAAERMHMSQSAMSNALARLREYFDDELLVQVGRRMELTPRAEALREAVRDVLVRVDTTIATPPAFDATKAEREFNLLVSDYTLQVFMPHVLALAQQQSARGVRFHLRPQVDQPQRMLERGEADLLVIPESYGVPEHPIEVVFEEEFCCLVWSGSRWAGKALSFEDYADAGHVVMQTSGGHPALEGWFMQRYGLSRRIEVTTFSFTSLPHLLVGTDRIATVHARVARQAQQSMPLQRLNLPVPMPTMKQAIQWHKYRTRDPGMVWLRELLHEAARVMDAAA